MDFGCRENENNVFWWFFKCFEKCVKRTRGKHMDFINDVDLELAYTWHVFDFIS